MTFGETVKELRERNSLSQAQLAENLGVSTRCVRGWESEGRMPKQAVILRKLASVLNCPMSRLTSGDHLPSAELVNIPVSIEPNQLLAATKSLFVNQQIPPQQQRDFIASLGEIYSTYCEEAS